MDFPVAGLEPTDYVAGIRRLRGQSQVLPIDCATCVPAPSEQCQSKSAISLAATKTLRAAFHAWVPMALVAFKDERSFVLAVGHPDGLTSAQDSPDGSRIYSLRRIKGVDTPPPTFRCRHACFPGAAHRIDVLAGNSSY